MNSTLTQAQKDALLAEVLGDVGLLRDDVAKLMTDVRLLPSEIEGVRNDAIEKMRAEATAIHQAAADQVGGVFFQRLASEATHAAEHAAGAAMRTVRQEFEDSTAKLRQAARELGTEATYAKDRNALAWRIGALSAALATICVSAALVIAMKLVSPSLLLSEDQNRHMELGHHLEQAWPTLDQATKARVQAAINDAAKASE